MGLAMSVMIVVMMKRLVEVTWRLCTVIVSRTIEVLVMVVSAVRVEMTVSVWTVEVVVCRVLFTVTVSRMGTLVRMYRVFVLVVVEMICVVVADWVIRVSLTMVLRFDWVTVLESVRVIERTVVVMARTLLVTVVVMVRVLVRVVVSLVITTVVVSRQRCTEVVSVTVSVQREVT